MEKNTKLTLRKQLINGNVLSLFDTGAAVLQDVRLQKGMSVTDKRVVDAAVAALSLPEDVGGADVELLARKIREKDHCALLAGQHPGFHAILHLADRRVHANVYGGLRDVAPMDYQDKLVAQGKGRDTAVRTLNIASQATQVNFHTETLDNETTAEMWMRLGPAPRSTLAITSLSAKTDIGLEHFGDACAIELPTPIEAQTVSTFRRIIKALVGLTPKNA